MPKRHDDLFDGIADFQALRAAALRAVKGKRRKPGAAAMLARLEPTLLRLERSLKDGTWRPGRYTEIEVTDPKRRIVSAAPIADRVVHHAVHAVVAPIFERGFIDHSFANRIGRGTHAAIDAYERYSKRYAHVLRGDIYRYFPAIDHAVLKADLRRRIACRRTLWLLDAIIDGSNAQEPVHLHFPGDDLLSPLERRRGLPIGNLTSQFFANLYLDPLDHFVTEVLGLPWVRYVDDVAAFADSAARLEAARGRIADFLAGRRLVLHPRKTAVLACARPAGFCGAVVAPEGRRLPEATVVRFRRRARSMHDRLRAGTLPAADAAHRRRAMAAHAVHAGGSRLLRRTARGWRGPGTATVPGGGLGGGAPEPPPYRRAASSRGQFASAFRISPGMSRSQIARVFRS